ncbi:MAG: T9SS type A sorting domain-containing protein [Ignavibacteriaceae bacterium]|nr:T9SS type A sorting domain-containing protein [Ignavibacteriaceae bacterium]
MSLRNNILGSIIFLLLLLLSNSLSYSQPFNRELNLIPVSDTEGLLKNIFSGGHNNLEHQFVDIDDDGDLDIFYLDSDRTFGWFENIGNKFSPDFQYSLAIPAGLHLSNWFYFIDIDSDGDKDYFTSNNDQISYFRNDGTANSPYFILAQDTVRDNEGNPIFSEFGSNPIFVDIDDDNDFDFITGNSVGTLSFFENIGSSQNFNFRFITDFWQNILIVGGGPADPRHGASSLDFVDIDGDLDFDLFWGDFFSKSIYVIENQGTPFTPDMHRTSNVYPINADSVYTSGFNMPRFADIDGDNDYDLFVSVLYDPTVPQSLMFYQNIGTPQSANHIFITKDLLKTFDVGDNSAPVFIDIDNDGDLDLFVGSLNNPIGSIHFLENTGDVFNPAFYYADSTFFDITSDLSVSPAFGDIDNDGDYDLIIGRFNGTLSLYLNSGSPSSPNFTSGTALLDSNGGVIDIGSSAVPFVLDVDNDMDIDLVIGGFNGKFYFYKNTGNPSFYQFALNSEYFNNLDVGDNATPFMIDIDSSGTFDLFSGNRTGEFYYYKNTGTNINPVWEEKTNYFINGDFGGNTAPCFVDIDNDTDYDLLLGNVKGGLYLYINSEISIVDKWENQPISNYSLEAFPNPFNPITQIRIKTKEGQKTKIEIYNLLGKRVKTLLKDYLPSGVADFYWSGDNDSGMILPSGIYFITASSAQFTRTIKVSFIK